MSRQSQARRLSALEQRSPSRSFCRVFEYDPSTELYSNVDFPAGVTSADLERLTGSLPKGDDPRIIIIPCNGR